jgi:threonine dehydratase
MTGSLFPYEWIVEAADRIQPYIVQTPLIHDTDRDLYLKCENRQITGSFKVRGALNKALALQSWEKELGFVAASAGNHGQGVALAGKILNTKARIFCSNTAARNKVEAMQKLGAEVIIVDGGYGEAEKAGLEYATRTSSTWISPYNDSQVIAGQGSITLEILRDDSKLANATWLVPTSGGGLASGIGIGLKQFSNKGRLIAVQALASPFMHAVYNGRNQDSIEDLPTIADGLSGPVQSGSITIPLIRHYVDEFILVDESEIEKAIAFAWWQYGEKIEGSAATALAAILCGKVTCRPAVLILSGGNIQEERFQDILSRHEKKYSLEKFS